jgi:hypothetical protein
MKIESVAKIKFVDKKSIKEWVNPDNLFSHHNGTVIIILD